MFDVPEDLSALTDEELNALEAEGSDAFDALPSPDDPTPTDEQVSEMEAVSAGVIRVREAKAERLAAAQARAERAAAAVAVMTPPEDTEAPAEEESPEEDAGEEGEEADDEEEAAPQAVAAAASPKKSVVKTAVRKTPPPVPASSGITLTAAADIPGVVAGSRLDDLQAMAKAFALRSKAFPTYPQGDDAPYPDEPGGPPSGIHYQYGVASMTRGLIDSDYHDSHYVDTQKALDSVGNERRLSGGSLTAAGGWCAPSETLYDLCGGETLEGLLDLPTMGISRGGIRFTTGPDFGFIYDNTGFCFTEAQVIAGATKPCFEIPCPTFQEVRLDVCGFCVKAPILTNVG